MLKKFRKTRYDRLIIGICAVILLYGILGFLALPPIVKKVAIDKISKSINREVRIEKIIINPFALSIKIQNIVVMDTDGEVFTSLGEFFVDFETRSVIKRALVFKEVRLLRPYFRTKIDENGVYNFSDLMVAKDAPDSEPDITTAEGTVSRSEELAVTTAEIITSPESGIATSEKEASENGPPINVIIDTLVISGGKVAYTDLSLGRTFETNLKKLRIEIKDFAIQSDGKSSYNIFTQTESDEQIEVKGEFTAIPASLDTSVRLANIKISKYSPYYHDQVGFDLSDGYVTLNFDFLYKTTPEGDIMRLDNGYFQLRSLQLDSRENGEKILSISDLSLKGILLDLAGRTFSVDSFSTDNGYLLVRLDKNGRVNLQKHFTPSSTEKSVPEKKKKTAPAGDESPWKVSVHDFLIDGYSVRFEDNSPSKPFMASLEDIRVKTGNVAIPASPNPNPLEISANYSHGGSINATGEVSIEPLMTNMRIGVSGIDIKSFQPYVPPNVKILITGGELGANGTLSFFQNAAKQPSLSYRGSVSVANFGTIERDSGNDLLKWADLTLSGIDVGYNPTSVLIQEAALTRLYTRLILKADGTTNVASVITSDSGQGAKQTENADETPPPAQPPEASAESGENTSGAKQAFNIKVVRLVEGMIDFSDQTINPAYNLKLGSTNGTISGLFETGNEQTAIQLSGKYNNYATYKINGGLNLADYKKYLRLKIDLKNLGLPQFTPYSSKFLGYLIKLGKLNLRLDYKIYNSRLDANNYIYMNQFTFGNKTDSKDAVSLPVRLAVSLLKDKNGIIEFELPVGGDLNNPKINIWKLVFMALKNLIVKIASAPFSALGASFGGGEDLGYVDFELGSSALNEAQQKKLDMLVVALNDHPDIGLEIQGGADAENDVDPLKRAKLNELLANLKKKNMIEAGETLPATTEMTITAEEYPTYIKMAYDLADFPKPEDFVQKEGQIDEGGDMIAELIASLESSDVELPKYRYYRDIEDIDATALTTSETVITSATMEKMLLDHIEITEDDLRTLAVERADAVNDYLMAGQSLDPERVFMVDPVVAKRESEEDPPKNRVVFTLN